MTDEENLREVLLGDPTLRTFKEKRDAYENLLKPWLRIQARLKKIELKKKKEKSLRKRKDSWAELEHRVP